MSRIQTLPSLTQEEEAVCLRMGTPWYSLAEHPSNSLQCWVRAKLKIHLPSTSWADYLKHVFLIHFHITHPGGVARAMWWPKEPNEFLLYFFKQASLRWLSLRAKNLNSSSAMLSKLGSVNPRASSDLDSRTICFEPEGQLRGKRAGSGLQDEWKSQLWNPGPWGPCVHISTQLVVSSLTRICGPFAFSVAWGDNTSVTFLLRSSVENLVRAWALELDYPCLPVTSCVTLGMLLTSLLASFLSIKCYLLLSNNNPKLSSLKQQPLDCLWSL